MQLGEGCLARSPITSHQPQGRSPGTPIPKKPNFPSFPHLGFSPAGSLAGNMRKRLVRYTQEIVTIISFLLNCTILTHTNASGSSTPVGNVLHSSASKLAAAEVTHWSPGQAQSVNITRQLCLILNCPCLSRPCLTCARAREMAPCPGPSTLQNVKQAPMPSTGWISRTCPCKPRKMHQTATSLVEEKV